MNPATASSADAVLGRRVDEVHLEQGPRVRGSVREMGDLSSLDATGQAELVRTRVVSPLELIDAAIERIERLNPQINAVISTDFERARAAARALPLDAGLFAGVPFLLKDIGANQAGLSTWLGNAVLKEQDHRCEADNELGARFRAAGLITLGKTNVPEMASSPNTDPVSCGPTRNPWDLERSAAGSSGGAAAAVASGMVPMAHANDGGGSTRLPAAWCGLVGLKPSRGRIPSPDVISRLPCELVVSRTVRDTAAALDAVHGATDADLYQLRAPVRSYRDELTMDPGSLRIGLITKGSQPVEAACVTGVENVAATLEQLGHDIVVIDRSEPLFSGGEVNSKTFPFNTARHLHAIADIVGRPLTEDEVEPYNWAIAERSRSISGAEFNEALGAQQAWAARAIEWSREFDIVLTPTAGCPAMLLGDLKPPARDPLAIGAKYGQIVQFTLPFNVTGQPAISLPLHRTAEGLPVGVQLVGGMGREDLLIRVAAQLEAATPWNNHPPKLPEPGVDLHDRIDVGTVMLNADGPVR